jgi:hypothetical protein
VINIAFYKGPAPTLLRRLVHSLICWRTDGQYSHVELVKDGYLGHTASFLDGGVRVKAIDFSTGRWDMVTTPGDEGAAIRWFQDHMGEPYDWFGLFGWVLPWRVSCRKWWFCSEAVAEAMGLPESWRISPNDLYRIQPKTP